VLWWVGGGFFVFLVGFLVWGFSSFSRGSGFVVSIGFLRVSFGCFYVYFMCT
jgi:hypothetical protein